MSVLFLSHVNTPYLVGAQYKTMAKYKTTNDFNQYENTMLGIKIDYPFNWNVEYNQGQDYRSVRFGVPQEIDPSASYLKIELFPLNCDLSLDYITGVLISKYKQNANNFSLVDNALTKVDNKSAYKTIFTYRSANMDFKEMQFNILLGENRYEISYWAEAKVYNKWLDIIQHMINSLEIHSPFLTNLVIDNNDLAVDPDDHTIYTVDYYEDRIYAINGTDNRIRYNISNISSPSSMAIDNFEYKGPRILFVTNRQNNNGTIIMALTEIHKSVASVPIPVRLLCCITRLNNLYLFSFYLSYSYALKQVVQTCF